jgi:hypothetical protein
MDCQFIFASAKSLVGIALTAEQSTPLDEAAHENCSQVHVEGQTGGHDSGLTRGISFI